jgi:flagellin
MGYLETGMRVLDSASSLLSRLQELAVLGANDTNTIQDHEAINLEAEALADEFNRLMTTSAYKGKDVFVDNASSEYVSVGGRNAEMTFGIGRLDYTELYDATNTTAVSYTGGPSNGSVFNLKIKPSDGVMAVPQDVTKLESGVTYEITNVSPAANALNATAIGEINTAAASVTADSQVINGLRFKVTGSDLANFNSNTKFEGRALFSDPNTNFVSLQAGAHYQITNVNDINDAAKLEIVADTDLTDVSQIVNGVTFTAHTSHAAFDSSTSFVGEMLTGTGALTRKIEAVQAKVNTARVQAGSQYAALESAIDYTTDLTAQYELGYNTVNDVNFSMETAHLAKNQILQQAATAMLAQANQGQASLLELIRG